MTPFDDAWFETVRPVLLPAQRAVLHPDTPSALTAARYGGVPASVAGEAWPTCQTCSRKLAFFAQFPARGQLWRWFYCLHCKSASFDDQKGVALLPLPLDSVFIAPEGALPRSPLVPQRWELEDVLTAPIAGELDEVDRKHPKATALLADLEEESDSDLFAQAQKVLAAHGVDVDEFEQSTRIGGYANFIQDVIEVTCPDCHRRMPLLARLGSHEQQTHWMWGDLGAVYLFACLKHPHNTHADMQCY